MKLTSENVHKVFVDCLFDEEPTEGTPFIPTKGIMLRVGFAPDKIEKNAEIIKELLDQLPENFNERTGSGWSFLNACVDKDENQWGEHQNVEELLLLGLGSGYVEYCIAREFWNIMPGGMPYFVVHDQRVYVATDKFKK